MTNQRRPLKFTDVCTYHFVVWHLMREIRPPSLTSSRRWQDPVDRHGLDKELVFLAYHYFDRYINLLSGDIMPDQVRLISIASLLIAIKTKLSHVEARVIDDIVEDMVVQHQIDRQALSSTEKAMLSVLNWHLNPPTMHQFARAFCLLHPLTLAGYNFHAEYLREATIFQVERALVQAEVMMNRSPSYIAYAAMMRAQDELDRNVFTSEMIDEVENLMNELELCERFVEETRFALENTIRRLPTIDEYMDSRERGEPLAVAIEREEASPPPETIRSHSPTYVRFDVFPL
jgi:hypothetical protein